jgi:hypothetical protein
MPGDPRTCRQHALACMLLAKEATTAQSKQLFHDLAQSWSRLAAELQDAQSLLVALDSMELSSAPSDDEDWHEEAEPRTHQIKVATRDRTGLGDRLLSCVTGRERR